jgi:DNA adenine methylase
MLSQTSVEILTLPYIKWVGGKREMIPRLRELWLPHKHRRLVDLTVGAAAIPLGLQPDRALLNDVNPHLINLHQWVKRGLSLEDFVIENTATGYSERRDRFNALITSGQADTREAAQLFFFLLRSCFNGLCRFNRDGLFNVGWGKYKTTPDSYRQDFSGYQAAFANWQFCCGDFADVPLGPEDFVFADPPYDSQGDADQLDLLGIEFAGRRGTGFTGYSADGFGWVDQVRLARLLAAHPAPVIAFNAATPRIVQLYLELGFEVEEYQARRSVSCNGDRTPAKEVLLYRNL